MTSILPQVLVIVIILLGLTAQAQQQDIVSYSLIKLVGSNYTEKIDAINARPITTNTKILTNDIVNGDIYIYDLGMIRKIDSSMTIYNVAGAARLYDSFSTEFESDTFALNTFIGGVRSLAVDPSKKHVYYIDELNGHIKQINSETNYLTKIIGSGGDTQASIGINYQATNIKSLTITKDGKSLFFLDESTLWKYDTSTFKLSKHIVSLPLSYTKVLLSPDETNFYALNSNRAIYRFSNIVNATNLQVVVSSTEIIDFALYDTFVYFLSNQTIQLFDGISLKIISGQPGVQSFKGDGGVASDAQYNNPTYLTVDNLNQIYVQDSENMRIRRIIMSPSSVKTIIDPTPAIQPVLSETVSIGEIADMAFDMDMKLLYICDKQNQLIRKFDGSSVQTLYSGVDCDGIAVNSENQVFISVTSDHNVYQIVSNFEKIVFAGVGVSGSPVIGAKANETRISSPTKLRFLSNDVLIVLLSSGISKISTSTGIIEIFSEREFMKNLFIDSINGYVYYGDLQSVFRKSTQGVEDLIVGVDSTGPNVPARSFRVRQPPSSGDEAIGYIFSDLNGIAVTPDGILYLSMKGKMMYVRDSKIFDLRFVDKSSGPLTVSMISRPRIHAMNLFNGRYVLYMTNALNNIYIIRPEYSLSCFGTSTNSSQVCSGRGICEEMNTCSCNSGFYGWNCEYATCFDVIGIQYQLVCNSMGNCYDTNNCTCQKGYTGQCLTPLCNGISANDTRVCSGHGTCNQPETCQCMEGYYGANCEITNCFGIMNNDPTACSGKGNCTEKDYCQCLPGYSGLNCSSTLCFGKYDTDLTVCSGHGSCKNPDTCLCKFGYEGYQCETFKCFGVYNNQFQVCSGNGKCIDINSCTCNFGFIGNTCENYTCYDVKQNDPNVCSGHGDCVGFNNCNCKSELGYVGMNCSIPVCFGHPANATGQVCSGKGKCIQPDTCQCSSGVGINCELTNCFGFLSNDSKACSGHGLCVSADNCVCDSQLGYIGQTCEIPACFGIQSNSSTVCSGNGDCKYLNNCTCKDGYIGYNCQKSFCLPMWSEENQNMTCTKPSSGTSTMFTNIETVTVSSIVSKVISFTHSLTSSIKFPSNFNQYLLKLGFLDLSQITIVKSVYNPLINSTLQDIQVLSPIISISLFDNNGEEISVNNLDTPIEIFFNDLKVYKNDANISCMYFDTSSKEWKSEGISTVILSKTSSDQYSTFSINCQTNHLTSFGIIDSNYKKVVNNRQDTLIELNKLTTNEIIAIAVSLGGSALILLVLVAVIVVLIAIFLRIRRRRIEMQNKLNQ